MTMIHLFLDDDSHVQFKRVEDAKASQAPEGGDPETLYIWAGGVGYFYGPSDRTFKVLPIHRVREIHYSRKPGEKWTD